MGVIRNFIEVIGVASEEDLPEKSLGQFIKYDEAETIFVPEDKPGIGDIYQISIDIDIKSNRTINTKDCKTLIIDGIKKLKIVYSQEQNMDKMVMLNLSMPFNTFIEIPKEAEDIEGLSLYVLDAYFDILEKRRIYAYFIYLIDVRYIKTGIDKPIKKNSKNIELLSFEEVNEKNVPQIALSHEDFILSEKRDAQEIDISEESYKKNPNGDIGCLYL